MPSRRTDAYRPGLVAFPIAAHCRHRLDTIARMQLLHHVGHVVLHRLLAQTQLGRHLTIGQAVGDLADDLFFAVGEVYPTLLGLVLAEVAQQARR